MTRHLSPFVAAVDALGFSAGQAAFDARVDVTPLG